MKNDVIKKYVKDLDGLLKEVQKIKGKLGDIDADTIYNVESAVIFVFGTIYKFFNFSSITFGKHKGLDAVVELNNEFINLEFETVSKDFERHRHNQKMCGLIICWKHDWKDCPSNIDVIELKCFWEMKP
jgi:hypothetical protein